MIEYIAEEELVVHDKVLQTYISGNFLSRVSILTRDIDITILSVRPFVCLFVRLSVRPSVTRLYWTKTA